MSRRGRINITTNEILSQETPEVQEKVLEDLLDNVQPKEEKIEQPKEEKPRKYDFKQGDVVKINSNVENDIMGRRIHNGLKNYTYRILSVRVDGMLIVECLTHCFTLRPEDVYKI